MRLKRFLLVLALCAAAPAGAAEVAIRSEPAMASVFWDGQYQGATPLTLSAAPRGRHGLKLTRCGYRNWVRLVTVDGAKVGVDAKLTATAFGALTIESVPDEANVSVNGELQGRTPLTIEHLAVGTVQVRVEKEEHLPARQEAIISAGRTTALKLTLKSKLEAFLLKSIKERPHRVNHYTELGHYYMTRRDYDRAFEFYSRGMDACATPQAIPNDCLRLYNELQYCYDGDVVKFAEEANLTAFRQRFVKLFQDAIVRVPSNERNYWQLAHIRQKEKDWPACTKLYEQAIGRARNSRIRHRSIRGAAQTRYSHGAQLYKRKRYSEAAAQYEKVLELYPRTYYARSAIASAISTYQYRLRDPKRVEALRRLYVEHFPRLESAPSYQKQIADTMMSEGRYKEAVAEYRRYLKQFPDDDNCPAILLAMADCCRDRLKDEAAALAGFVECAERYPDNDAGATALASAAHMHETRGDKVYAAALRRLLVERYPLSPLAAQFDENPKTRAQRQDAAALYAAASAAERRGAQEAIGLYEQLLQKHAQTYHGPLALLRVVSLHKSRTRDLGKEMAARDRFVQLYPKHNQAPSVLMTMASRYSSAGKYEQAAAAYRRVMKEYPQNDSCPSACYQIGMVYHRKTYEQRKAVEAFQTVVDRWPDHSYGPASLYYVGWIYFLCLKDTSDEAIVKFRELLTRYPYENHAGSIEYWLDALQKTKPEPASWWK